METTSRNLVSRVMVLEDSPEHIRAIKAFCGEHSLVGLRVRRERLCALLHARIDFGAILLAENYGGSWEECVQVVRQIHAARPELPIILRREGSGTLNDLPDGLRGCLHAAFMTSDMAGLREVLDQCIFSLKYPNALIRGLSAITSAVLASQFPNMTIAPGTPSIVRDRFIFGELFSLIQLESMWCRGYMMMQAVEEPILDRLTRKDEGKAAPNFRDVNSLLGEITNLIWGAFKNRYIGDPSALMGNQVQIPLVVNHKHKYISFGTENPQLCFTYRLSDEVSGRSMKLQQRFVFNLAWSPEDFHENPEEFGAMADTGELELF